MATTRKLLQALHHSLGSSSLSASAAGSFRSTAAAPLLRVCSLQQRNGLAIRAQSSWVIPSQRGRPAAQRPTVNGRSVAFHVNDLKAASKTSYSDAAQPITKSSQVKPLKDYDSDLIVVLDMDECLIHSQFLQGPGSKFAHQVRRTNGSGPMDPSVETFNIFLPDGEMVLVHERPHLHEFLEAVSSKYETHVFTAAMEVYAKPVLDTLDPKGTIFTKCWYRESCVMDSNVGAYVKDLDFEWGDRLKRTVLVDNNPMSFLANPSNGILVSSFYNDPHDTTLPAVLNLLEELNEEEDVRPMLESRFGLKQALKELQSGRNNNSATKSRQYGSLSTPSSRQQEVAVAAAS
jgi:Dullard-like phosphatase family protein